MQRTRLNTLVNTQALRFQSFFDNPWRTISLVIISLLLGFFLGTATISSADLSSYGDLLASIVLLIVMEITNRWLYVQKQRPLWVTSLNFFKIGFIHSFFLQALIVGS